MNKENLVNLLLIDSVKKAINELGIEGTYEAIERNYPYNSILRHKMRETYFNLVYKR